MKISGIICEYNPFHNGHLYHIRETRKNGATHIVAVMSGNFVQRGDVAIMDKLERDPVRISYLNYRFSIAFRQRKISRQEQSICSTVSELWTKFHSEASAEMLMSSGRHLIRLK